MRDSAPNTASEDDPALAPPRRAVRLAAAMCAAPAAGLWRLDGSRVAAWGLTPETARCADRTALALIADPATRLREGAPFAGVMAAKARDAQGAVVGLLCVFDDRPRRFPDALRRRMEDLAAVAGATEALAARTSAEAREARRLQTMFDAIVDNTEALVFVKRRDGALVAANRKYRAEARRSTVAGLTDSELFGPETGAALRARDRAIFETGEPFCGEEVVRLPDGRLAHYLTSKFLVFDPAVDDMVLCAVATDITAQKEMQAALEESRREADGANLARSQFLSAMSHEIRTPMNGVLGMLALLATTELTETQATMARVARDSAASLLELLNDVLDYARMEVAAPRIDARPFKLRPAVSAAVSPFRAAAVAKGLDLRIEVDEDAPQTIGGDAARFRQVLGNLVSNAIKFTPRGAVVVRVQRDAGDVRVAVQDTGVGIAKADQARVFARFSQADAGWSRQFGGVGLGLTICKLLVAAMNGEIGLHSAPGRGSTFWFSLPVAAPAPAAPPDA